MRKAKDQKVVQSCQSKDDLDTIMSKLKSSYTQLHVEPVKNKDPLVIKDVLAYNTDDDVVTAIKRQNSHLLSDVDPSEIRV